MYVHPTSSRPPGICFGRVKVGLRGSLCLYNKVCLFCALDSDAVL